MYHKKARTNLGTGGATQAIDHQTQNATLMATVCPCPAMADIRRIRRDHGLSQHHMGCAPPARLDVYQPRIATNANILSGGNSRKMHPGKFQGEVYAGICSKKHLFAHINGIDTVISIARKTGRFAPGREQ